MACAPEPHTRFTVSAGTETGTPPPSSAWRAGFILLPAWITLPSTTDPSKAGSSFARASVSRTAIAPSSVAGTPFSAPLNAPIAVRTGWHNTISRAELKLLIVFSPLIRKIAACTASFYVCICTHSNALIESMLVIRGTFYVMSGSAHMLIPLAPRS
jgi:hypothetical protein